MHRRTLPPRRYAETFTLNFWKCDWQVTVGFYKDNRPGEVFISGAKSGTDTEAIARDGAVLLSLALQYGIPLDVINGALTRNLDDTPGTIVGEIVRRLVG